MALVGNSYLCAANGADFFTLVYLRSFPHMSKQQRIWLGLLILSFYHFFFMIFIILTYKPTGSYFNIWLTAFEHLKWLF